MKKYFRKLAAMVVTYYCNRIYRKAVKNADEQHAKEGEMFYVVDHLIKGQTLSVINRKMFRKMKMDAQRWTNPLYEVYFDKEYNIQMLKDSGWYHTADRSGQNGLTPKDKEVRRLAFIRMGLQKAKLLG